jgi:hypothetical protein
MGAGRFNNEDTPEGRLAAIAVMLAVEFEDRYARTRVGPQKPDVADLREALRPYVLRELLHARIEESERVIDTRVVRTTQLVKQLYEVEAMLPMEHRL